MVDDMSLGAFIRAAVVMGAKVDIHLPILELLPGQGQRMTAAVTEQQPPKQVLSPHPGRTAMFCPDFCRLLEDLPADDRLVGVGDNHPLVIRYNDGLSGFVIHNLRFQQDQITGVDRVAQDLTDRSTVPSVGGSIPHRTMF